MGGLQCIFIGDFFQLPPVNRHATALQYFTNDKRTAPQIAVSAFTVANSETSSRDCECHRFCFETSVWRSLFGDVQCVEAPHQLRGSIFVLEQVHRQRGQNQLIDALNDIRHGQLTEQAAIVLHHCVGKQLSVADGILPTEIFTHKYEYCRVMHSAICLCFTHRPVSQLSCSQA